MFEAIFRWETLFYLMLVLYVPCCIGLIVVVLLQKGKGVGFAGAFGIGPGSDTVFGPRMSKSLPVRITQIMAGVFMLLALCMSLISGKTGRGLSPELVDESGVATTSQQAPAAPAVPGLEDLGAASKSAPAAAPAPAAATPTPAVTPPAPAAATPAPAAATPAPAATPPASN